MLSEALQRNAKHKARLSNISVFGGLVRKSDQRFFALLRMTFCEMGKVLFSRDLCESREPKLLWDLRLLRRSRRVMPMDSLRDTVCAVAILFRFARAT